MDRWVKVKRIEGNILKVEGNRLKVKHKWGKDKHKMSLKLHQLAKELPNNEFNIAKTARKIGYKESYINTQLPTTVRNSKVFKEYFNEKMVKRELKKALKECKNEKDRTNLLRSIELMSKILGMQIDKSENKVELVTKPEEKEELIRLRGGLLSPTVN